MLCSEQQPVLMHLGFLCRTLGFAATVSFCCSARPQVLTAAQSDPSLTMPQPMETPWRIASYADQIELKRRWVFDIAFGTNHATWLAVRDGLYRYDGFKWSKFTVTNGLPSSFIRTVTVTRDGTLWIGTDRYAGVFDGVKYDSRGSDRMLPGPNVRRIVEDSDGTLWFCCDRWPDPQIAGGLCSLKDGRWHRYGIEDGLPSDHVLDYLRTSSGRRIVLTQKGPAVLEGSRWKPLDDPGFPLSDHTWSMVETPQGALFAQGYANLLIGISNRWQACKGASFPVCVAPDGEVVSIAVDRRQGTFFFNRWNGSAFVQASAAIPSTGLEWYVLKAAPDGAIWCVGRGTILRWERQPGEWTQYANLPPPRFLDRADRVWFANSEEAFLYDGDRFQPIDALRWPIIEDETGAVWGLSSTGIARFKDNQISHFTIPSAFGQELGSALIDAQGRPWFYTISALKKAFLLVYEGERWKEIGSEVLTNFSIINATADPLDGLWLSTIPSEGAELLHLFRIHSDGRLRQIEFSNRSLLPHRPGIIADEEFIWLHSYAGLFRAPRNQPEQLVKITGPVSGLYGMAKSAKGLLAFQCSEAVDGPAGLAFWRNHQWRYWPLAFPGPFELATDGSIIAADGNTVHLSPRLADHPAGTVQLPVNTSLTHLLKGARQDYWFGSDAGTFQYRPTKQPPDTFVQGFDKRIRQDTKLRLKVTALKRFESMAQSTGFTYSWRFGEETWSGFQAWPEEGLSLAELSRGDHVIEVRAQDAIGNVDPSPERYGFSVLPIPLQERFWFLPTVGFITGLISFLTYLVWRSRQRLAEHAARLEEKVAERTADLKKDIERRERVERELSLSESRFRGVFNSTYEFIGLLTTDGRVLETNPASLSIVEARVEDVRGQYFWDTPWWNHSAALQQRVREAIRDAGQGKPVLFETYHLRPNGEVVTIDFSIKPVWDESGRVVFLIPEGHDISARKKAETDRQSLQEQLSQAQKMESVGRLAGGVAHDFNNLLTAILGNLELVLQSSKTLTPEDQEFLMESQRAGKRASELTRQLLAFSRKQILETKPVDLNQVILGFGKMLNRLIGEDLEVRTHLEPRLGMVKADPVQMEQVLLNLALNARDAMPRGGRLTIETSNVELDAHYAAIYPEVRAGRWIRLVVSDTGCGMDAETQKRVFEPFFTTKPLGKGTGLGLATVYGVVKQHEGHITVYSEPGKGTTFKIYVPLLESYDPDEQDSNPHEPINGTETILVVEDEPAVRKLTCRMLKNHGYQVLEARDGAEAIEHARQSNAIDLLLTDVIMPGMSGMAVYQAIHSLCPNIKVLYCSGYTGSVIEHHGILENDLQFMQKPFSAAILTRKIRETLDSRSS